LIVPQGAFAPAHAVPETFQTTCWFVLPVTLALKSRVAPGPSVTLGGETLTTT
jgi:hypothetical protein